MKPKLLHILFAILMLAATAQAAPTGRELLRRGLDYAENDNFPMALKFFTKSLETAENEGDYNTMEACTGYIGNVYYNLNDHKRSLSYQLKGYNMAIAHGDTDIQSRFLANIVANYCKLNDAKNARHYFDLLQSQRLTQSTDKYNLLYNRARLAMVEGDTAAAIKHHKRALRYARSSGMGEEFALFQYCELGEIYMKLGDYAKAIEYAHICEPPAKRLKAFDLLVSVYQLLWNANEAMGDKAEADKYHGLCLSLSDTIFNRNTIFSADNELRDYETRQTDEHIASLNGVISRQTLTIISISLLLLLLLLLSFLLLRNNRKLRLAHSTLLQKTRELQLQEEKNEQLLGRLIADKPADKPADDTREEPPSATPNMESEQMKGLLTKIMKVIDDTAAIANPDFSLNTLAEAVESNTKYVSQIINETYGKNFKTLLNERRIREACRLLADRDNYGKMTIQAVYEEVGYTNAVSFIRAFRKVNGMTPSEYQKILRQDTADNEV